MELKLRHQAVLLYILLRTETLTEDGRAKRQTLLGFVNLDKPTADPLFWPLQVIFKGLNFLSWKLGTFLKSKWDAFD
jgi:hypothetical protein